MDDFRKKLKARQILLLFGFLFACCAFWLARGFAAARPETEHLSDFIAGFQAGFTAAILGLLAFAFVKNLLAMRSPEKLKKLYIAETDERMMFIRQKTGSTGMLAAMFGLALGSVAAGNFNITVCLTLLGACMFVCLIFGGLKLYYYKKY